jgi:Ca2+-binding EF-hand superfamily protein|eukprot:COSAG01_NODE_139_length_24311_cov_75.405873_12_plen_65_part_00
MDSDGSGELDREELLQLMQIMEPRRGITSEELDEAMAEIDTSGDGLVDFDEFSAYWENHLSDGG